MSAHRELPSIVVGMHDYNPLLFAATLLRQRGDANAEFLTTELRRATLCRPDDLPRDVVATNSRVVFRIDEEPEAKTCVLVRPEALEDPDRDVSVLTPLGTALLGLHEGDRMPFRASRDGPLHEVVVVRVEDRPGARRGRKRKSRDRTVTPAPIWGRVALPDGIRSDADQGAGRPASRQSAGDCRK